MPRNYQPGDAVAVLGGIFKGFTGTVIESGEDCVLVVAIKIFGRSTRITVASAFVRPRGPNDFDPPSQRLDDLRRHFRGHVDAGPHCQ